MKQCPKCNRSYDDSQSFCLMDGTPLINESEEETVVRRMPAPAKSKTFLWLGLAILVLLGGGIILGGFMIYKFKNRNETAAVKRQSNANLSTTPAPLFTPTTTPKEIAESTPAAESTPPPPPTPETSKSKQNDSESEEITPIGWDTTATGFKGGDGQTYKFQCPPNGKEYAIWGSDIYTTDSSICTASVHAGLFSLASGGVVTIEYRPGRQIYGSTVRNGIKSNTYGEFPHSFVVR